MTEDNWFEKAARDAEASERGVEAARRAAAVERAKEVERKIEERRRERIARLSPSSSSSGAAEAMAIFEAVASGKASPLGTGPAAWPGGSYHHPGGTVGMMRPPATSTDYATGRLPGPTPEQGLEAILRAIRKAGEGHLTGQENADALFKAGGEWITKVTNAITQIIRESEDES